MFRVAQFVRIADKGRSKQIFGGDITRGTGPIDKRGSLETWTSTSVRAAPAPLNTFPASPVANVRSKSAENGSNLRRGRASLFANVEIEAATNNFCVCRGTFNYGGCRSAVRKRSCARSNCPGNAKRSSSLKRRNYTRTKSATSVAACEKSICGTNSSRKARGAGFRMTEDMTGRYSFTATPNIGLVSTLGATMKQTVFTTELQARELHRDVAWTMRSITGALNGDVSSLHPWLRVAYGNR